VRVGHDALALEQKTGAGAFAYRFKPPRRVPDRLLTEVDDLYDRFFRLRALRQGNQRREQAENSLYHAAKMRRPRAMVKQ